MNWYEYLNKLIAKPTEFDKLKFSSSQNQLKSDIPGIIKATVLLLDEIIDTGQVRNIIVFPERRYSVFLYTLIKLIQNIAGGKIFRNYDLSKFEKGQKLKYKNVILEYVGLEKISGKEMLTVRFTDMLYKLPIEFAPYLQRTESLKLSSYNSFAKIFNIGHVKASEDIISILRNYRTHMDKSLVFASTISKTKEKLRTWEVNNINPVDLFLIGQLNNKGKISNIVKGQLQGVPSLLLASNLYAVNEGLKKGIAIQSLIVDIISDSVLDKQLDIINEIIQLDVPITFLTDTINSFQLNHLTDRGFKIWRWDKEYLEPMLYQDFPANIYNKYKNFIRREIFYEVIEDEPLTPVIRKLSILKSDYIENFLDIEEIYGNVFGIVLRLLRTVAPMNYSTELAWIKILSESRNHLTEVMPFISETLYRDLLNLISEVENIIGNALSLTKIHAIKGLDRKNNNTRFNLIVEDKSDKKLIQQYWDRWLRRSDSSNQIKVMTYSEYMSKGLINPYKNKSVSIISGWFSEDKIRKLLYSFNDVNYHIIMYSCENVWKQAHTVKWTRSLSINDNQALIDEGIKYTKNIKIPVRKLEYQSEHTESYNNTLRGLDQIEQDILEANFRKYQVSKSLKHTKISVKAIPTIFAGGSRSLFTETKKIITVTGIILDDEDKEKIKKAEDLCVGDFIVLRETDKDLVREIADANLEKRKASELRAIATRWKKSLEKDQHFEYPNLFYKRFISAGSTKNKQTIISWLYDESKIAPQQLKDIELIAKVTKDEELAKNADIVFNAARLVTNAHIEAGRQLSRQLRKHIAVAMQELDDFDPEKVIAPIELQLENIGLAKVLKIMDIRKIIEVDPSFANRLLTD